MNANEWKIVKVKDVFKTSSGGTPLAKNRDYYENGTIPWLNSGEVSQGYIYKSNKKITELGLRNSSAKIFPKDTVLVAMYGATAGQVGILKIDSATNQAICGIYPDENYLPEFLYQYLKTQTQDLLNHGVGAAQPNISQEVVKNIQIPFPPIFKQKKIVDVLQSIDDVIQKTELIISNHLRLKRGYLNIVFSNQDGWKKMYFNQVTEESRIRNTSESLGISDVYGVFKSSGFAPMKERIIGKQLLRYKIVEPNNFAYNPMRLNIGSIAYNNTSSCFLVSPDYVVFRCKDELVIPDFINYFRQSQKWNSFTEKSGDGSVRVRIYYSHLSKLTLGLPTKAEQQKIVDILKSVDYKIDAESLYKEKLIKLKKGLMNDIFSQKVEVGE